MQADISDETVEHEQYRVAIGCGPRCRGGTHFATTSRNVLDIEILPEALGKFLRNQACEHVDRPARRDRRDDLYPVRWIGFGACNRGCGLGSKAGPEVTDNIAASGHGAPQALAGSALPDRPVRGYRYGSEPQKCTPILSRG